MTPHDRRVSFSDHVSYSDDASATTVSTEEDEFDLDDDDDDDTLLNSGDNKEEEEMNGKIDSDDDDDDSDDESLDLDAAYLGLDDDDDDSDDDEDDEEETEYEDADDDDVEEDYNDEMEEEDTIDPSIVEDASTGKEEIVEMVKATSEHESNKSRDEMTDSSDKTESNEATSVGSYYDYMIQNEPPLSFRDTGVIERPSDYLGGYGPETYLEKPHKVKLRKSWVANANAEDEGTTAEHSDYNEYEAWKKERAEQAAARKARAYEAKQVAKKALESVMDSSNRSEPSETESATPDQRKEDDTVDDASGPASILKKSNPTPDDAKLAKPTKKDTTTEVPSDMATPAKMPKSALKKRKKNSVEKKIMAGEAKEAKNGLSKATKPGPIRRVIKPRPKDPETIAHEKECLELKEQIAKLQRKLDTIEVRKISQLADLEEETAKRMRDYRAKADEIVRRQKAKNEKKALKQKAMKSQDFIAQLRKSNQKLRAEGVKIQSAIAKLRETNQVLEEKNSVHRGYAAEFLAFQKIEVGLAEQMNKSLNQDLPKYEKLIRSMEDGVTDRVKSGHVERKAKELYEDCIDTMVEMLEENCGDPTLMDKLSTLINDESDDESAMMDNSKGNNTRFSGTTTGGARRRSTSALMEHKKPNKMDTANSKIKKSKRKFSTKSTPTDHDNDGSTGSSPTKSSLRNSSYVGSGDGGTPKKSNLLVKTTARRRATTTTAVDDHQKATTANSRDSFRSTRTPFKSSSITNKVISSDSCMMMMDDASVCSFTSMTSAASATSGNFSITDYAY